MPNHPERAAQVVPSDSVATIGERVLLLFCRKAGTEDYRATTSNYTLDNALNFARKTIPDFDGLIRDKFVLDYGCGHGWQAVAMHKAGARRVTGTDILDERLAHGRTLAERERCAQNVAFYRSIPDELKGQVDVVLSLSAFEHFDDPAAELQSMKAAARPGGLVIVSFAEPWFSPHGSHMVHFTNLPWVNVMFSERTVMRVRSRYRSDGAVRYEQVDGGLNRMTLARFEQIIRRSGMAVESLDVYPVRGLPLVGRIPLLREFLVAAASCVLRKS